MIVEVEIEWAFNGKTGKIIDKFGYPEYKGSKKGVGGLMYWYEEGNGSCDCNRGPMIGVGRMKCGHRVIFLSIKPVMDTLQNKGKSAKSNKSL